MTPQLEAALAYVRAATEPIGASYLGTLGLGCSTPRAREILVELERLGHLRRVETAWGPRWVPVPQEGKP